MSKESQKAFDFKDDSDLDYKENADIRFNNPPFMTGVYSDHERNTDIVCVAVLVISGSEDINFVSSEDVMKLSVTYFWPEAMYSPALLFQ